MKYCVTLFLLLFVLISLYNHYYHQRSDSIFRLHSNLF